MVDRGPLLTSAIIFYLSIGAAIFEVLEEPHWRSATDNYKRQKTELLKQFPCLGQEGLDRILQFLTFTLYCSIVVVKHQLNDKGAIHARRCPLDPHVYSHEQRFAYPGLRLIYREIFYLPTRVIGK
ncbi:hypothetical protein DUI87_10051 [Hirundo rustica rustica]|uniref:Uncharacterized protein n=1 Tax=Hirundo rustica rustica TaxID=333673 RepID=A0A3M0KIR5_HIRRU|nr:hypothetical protein DUI87_10051 [Hirundo rustica rustica]